MTGRHTYPQRSCAACRLRSARAALLASIIPTAGAFTGLAITGAYWWLLLLAPLFAAFAWYITSPASDRPGGW